MIKVVGGVYYEECLHPQWQEIYGSAGRAAQALLKMGETVELHTYADEFCQAALNEWKVLGDFKLYASLIKKNVTFRYMYGLAEPLIITPEIPTEPLKIQAEQIISFGLIEGNAIVEGDYVVYDPQSVKKPLPFTSNGSKANHLALLLNRYEAIALSGLLDASPEKMASLISSQYSAEVVVIKMGPKGALVFHDGRAKTVPAYATDNVWPIGSGDTFVAHFGLNWMIRNMPPHDAALEASRATAYYCQTQALPTLKNMSTFVRPTITVSQRFNEGYKPIRSIWQVRFSLLLNVG